MLPKALLSLTAALALAGCQSSPTAEAEKAATTDAPAAALLTPGPWRGELATQGQKIPFQFEVQTEAGKPVVYLINKGLDGEERLRCDEISAAGDSVTIRMHIFDAALVVRAAGPDKLTGTWVKYDAKEPYRVPLTATAGAAAAPAAYDSQTAVAGTWRVTFDDNGKTYPAVGIFQESAAGLTGTFLTTTGDYRFLSGQVYDGGRRLELSTFDGSHAFLFRAAFTGENGAAFDAKKDVNGDLQGDFYSGKTGHETWTAVKDADYKLPDANTLTGLKPGQTRLDFKFPNIYAGGSISPTDPKYQGKVVVLQVLGSWCPNCMDETNFLAPWYEKNKARGVEVIGLGYERTPDQDKAAAKLRSMRERMHIGYDVAVAGQASAAEASKSLPQLKGILAFPTTIFLDKKGNVRKVHTGFSGPGTGKYYEAEIADFNRTVDQLLAE